MFLLRCSKVYAYSGKDDDLGWASTSRKGLWLIPGVMGGKHEPGLAIHVTEAFVNRMANKF